jgi:hypothetical protein
VTVHIDPEDDEDAPTCRGLPLRAQVLSALDAAWQGAQLAQPHDTRLHYLGGKIDVELILPLASYADAETASRLQAQLEEAARNLPWFRRLRVLYG